MAFSATAVIEVRTGGSDALNGGGFNSAASGTDFSQQAAAQINFTDMVIGATTTQFTSAGNPNVASLAGNFINVTAGTGFTVQRVQVLSVAAGVATCDKSLGTTASTGGTGSMGGALSSPGLAASLMAVDGMMAYVKNDGAVFSLTSAATNVIGGCLASSVRTLFIGYATTRSFGNTDTGPTLQVAVNSATVGTSNTQTMFNLILDGNSGGGFTASRVSSGGGFIQCQFKNFNTASANLMLAVNCSATGNSAAVFAGSSGGFINCEAWANSATPFVLSGQTAVGCTSTSNTSGALGFTNIGMAFFANCSAVSNAGTGFTFAASLGVTAVNCIAESNTGVGFAATGAGVKQLINCASFGNSARSSGTFNDSNPLNPSASVFVLAPTNLALNALPGVGALLRSASYPAVGARGTTSNYLDIGAFQRRLPTTAASGRA